MRLNHQYSPLSFAPYPPSALQVEKRIWLDTKCLKRLVFSFQSDVTSLLHVMTDQAHGTIVQWQGKLWLGSCSPHPDAKSFADDAAVGNQPGSSQPLLNVTYEFAPGVILSGA
jgi:hypothetical protein